jgi:phage terminase large subunit-like protein
MKKRKDLILEELVDYCHDVEDKKIIACQKYIWACRRFLNDIERSNNGDMPYIFNPQISLATGEYDEHDKPTMDKFYPVDRYLDWMRLFKHSKGELAGKPKIPAIYEKFVYGNIYGWVHKDTHSRRFRRSYEQLARKNAKSQDKGIQALYEISAFGEQMAEAYVAATKKADTRHVWSEAKWLYSNSEYLRDSFTCKFEQDLMQVVIRHKKSGSFFMRLSKDDKKTGDGACPQFMCLDEYHLHETTEYYDIGTSGMKTRKQPLLSIITTAGFDLSHPCYAVEYEYVSKILNPNIDVENDRYFVAICEADLDEDGVLIDPIDSDEIRLKSNPIIGNTETGKESILIDLSEALDKPEKMRDVKTKTFNIWINERTAGYMNMEKWKACGATAENPFPDVKGMRCFPGIDLSATLDLTSVGFDIPLGEERYAILSHSFMPEETYKKRMKENKIRFDLWREKGWLTVTDGAEVNYHIVLKYILDTFEKYEWPKNEFCFDKAMATWLSHELQEAGFPIPVEIYQGYRDLSEPTKDLRAKVYSGKVIHDNNPVLNWVMSNAIIRKSPNESIMLDKDKASEKIDPVAAIINAHNRAMVNEPIKRSIYEERASFRL